VGTNTYFHDGHTDISPDQRLMDQLTIEVIQIHGQNMVYCPRKLVKEDRLLGEDVMSAFEKTYRLEMYIESVQEFGGQGDLLGKFGLEIDDEVDLVVSRTRFKEETELDFAREGDLIYFPLANALFEVVFVEHENPFYQLGKLTTFKMKCRLFDYSQEEMNTGYSDIDMLAHELENDNSIENSLFADNDVIKEESDDVIDFDEKNPFGEL
jgi:hypothetical protein